MCEPVWEFLQYEDSSSLAIERFQIPQSYLFVIIYSFEILSASAIHGTIRSAYHLPSSREVIVKTVPLNLLIDKKNAEIIENLPVCSFDRFGLFLGGSSSWNEIQ